jgi:phosphatidylglycerol lysyltransferase
MKLKLSTGNNIPLHKSKLLPLGLIIVCLGLALFIIHKEMKAYPLESIVESFYAIPPISVSLALLATIISYLGIAFYDGLALRYTDKPLSWKKTAFTSCCAHAISTTLGAAALTSNAVRYRLYSSWGLKLKDVGVVGAVTLCASLSGAFSLMAFGLLLETETFNTLFKIPGLVSISMGIAILSMIVGVHIYILKGPEKSTFKGIQFLKPSGATLSLQWLSSAIDWIAAAAVLYVLMPANSDLGFLTFIPIFVAAQYLGTMSGLPGGIGVFEAIFLILVPNGDTASMAAALIIYRAVYYIFPLFVSVITLTIQQGFGPLSSVNFGRKRALGIVTAIAPILYGILTFCAGGVMIIASALPSFLPRINYMARFVPEAIIEISHLFASGVGTLLLIVSLGLWRRLHNAWTFALILFPAAALFTYVKGGDTTSICFLLILALCLSSSKEAFYRRGKISNLPLTPMRFTALIGTVSLAIWSGFYAYRNQAYSQELWWNFGLQEDASRFLRASALVGAIILVYLVWRLLQPSRAPDTPETSSTIIERVRSILEASDNAVSESNLALIGDKQFLFSDSQKSFIMYGVKGRNWIALGEPIGLESERRELLLKFHDAADHCGASPCFYSIRGRNLNDFTDIGLSVQKIGEMALVPIKEYNLAGKTKARLRQARNRAAREGITFDVINVASNSEKMDRLERISQDWLRHQKGREKKFSLGCFDRNVLSAQPIAVAIRDGEIIAFSNLWSTPDKSELSLDLMRYTPDCMTGVMNYLFTEVMIWGASEGYDHFSLGMAPMSGLDKETYTSAMSRVGRFVFKYGGKFYGFQGLRSFKKKFNPDWEPVYIAAPTQASMPRALSNLALLSAGGFSGLLRSS